MENVTTSTAYEKDFAKITLTRNTSDYELLMMWSKVFLLGKSFTSFSGSAEATALLFDMNKVFEAYVGRHVKRIFEIKKSNFAVKLQEQFKYLFDKPAKFTLKPDIVVRKDDEITAIMDTKWKHIKSDKDISQGDMYQMFAYAHRYNTSDIWLIYPKTEVEYSGAYKFTSNCANFEVRIHLFFVDIEHIETSVGVLLDCVEEGKEQNQQKTE